MALQAILSNHAKYDLAIKALHLGTDSIKVLLMRNGFVFDKDVHARRKYLKANTGVIAMSVGASLKYTRASGSFITDGFVAGNRITASAFTNGGNNGVKYIQSVTWDEITVTDTTGMVQEAAGGNEQIIADDELATGSGYTQDTKVLAGATLVEDDANNWGQASFTDVTWTASGGSIGPTPGAILYDDTSADDTILGYLDFDGNKTAADTEPFVISGIKFRKF